HLEPNAGAPRVSLRGEGPEARAWARALRDAGVRVTRLGVGSRAAAMTHARAWGADAVLSLGARGEFTRISDGAKRTLSLSAHGGDLEEWVAWLHAGDEIQTQTRDVGRSPTASEVG
ncbi:MAG: hypothetical protein GXP55_00535, partial [Deltaproteobacteria bacterium]|nr:hypothetical protein [Deltaproteobacteria bacterium]